MRPKRKFAIVILALVLLLVALGVLGDGGGGFSVQYSGRWLGFSRGLYYVHTPNGKSRLKGRFYVVGPITAYNLDPDVTILPSPNQNAAEISQKVPVNEIVQLIQERDGGNTPSVSYTRGIDLSGSMEGAGGIGGLLARSSGYDCINTPLTVCITNNTSTDCIFWIYSDAGTNIDGAILTAGNTGVYTFNGIGGVGYTVWGTDYRARELEILNTWTPTLDHHALDLGPGDPEDYSASDSGDTFCADPDAWPHHDYYFADGNGNIVTLIDTNQSVSASYRYDPFGNITSQSGAMADANTYRFSSKEFHVASGLYYYGYRFYDPNLQRWVNRDPIGKEGGLNLYAFVAGDPILHIDEFGLYDISCCDGDTISKGKQSLINSYNGVHSELEQSKIPHHGHEGSSCQTVNGYALMRLGPTPPCWTCILEHREKSVDVGRSPHIWGADHWVIVCQSHPKSGPYQEISFDYWEDRPPGESPNHFRSEYPEQLGGALRGGSIDCGGNVTTGPNLLPPTPHK